MSRLGARVVLLALAIVVAAALGEVILRALDRGRTPLVSWQTEALHRPDDELVYSLAPGASSEWRSGEFVERARINAFGVRGKALRDVRPALRVVVLGDSMTFGHGVSDEQTYPARLEARLSARGRDVEVINAGVRGYGTDHAFRFFVKRLRGLDPDVVVFAFYRNDPNDDIDRPLYALEAGELVELDATKHRLYRIGRIYGWLPQWARRSRLAGVLVPALAEVGAHPEAPARRTKAQVEAVRQRIAAQFAELERLSKEDGFALILLAIPYRSESPPRDHYRWLHGLAFERATLFDPSLDREWREQEATLFFREDDHLSPAGHDQLAAQLQQAIEEHGLLQAQPTD